MAYGAQLASLLGRPMDAASDFRIVLRCTHEETEQEGRWLAGAPSPGKARRRTHGGGQAKEQGTRLIHEVPFEGAGDKLVAFLHPKSTFGVLTEFCQSKH